MADCSQCKRFKRQELLEFSYGCFGKEFYEPGEITFCQHQIRWILANAELLKSGSRPTELSSYVDIPIIGKGGKGRAKFISSVEIIAEIERRLEHCGLDGLLTYLYYSYGFDENLLAKYYRLDPSEVKHRIGAVIWFISGWNFYMRPYRRFNVYRAYDLHREVKVA